MQLRICIYHQSHLSLFGNCWDPFEGSFSTFYHLRLYENSKEVLLVGDPFPYRDQQEGGEFLWFRYRVFLIAQESAEPGIDIHTGFPLLNFNFILEVEGYFYKG